MASSLEESDDGFAADIVGAGATYSAPRPPKKEFLAWHQPRKQFVRDRQWCRQINQMLEEGLPTDGLLKYLGLPGIDLLDLRHFHAAICSQHAVKIRFLGFNSGAVNDAQIELNISLDEVRRLDSIDARSEVIPDNFTKIALLDSVAWKRTRDLGPYDVVNLDLCDGFAAHEPGDISDTHYNAITQLLALQARQKTPWLLLLTTRAGNDHVHKETLNRLLEKYAENLQSCASFKKESGDLFNVSDKVELDVAVNTPDGHLPVFLIALCKWMLTLSAAQAPPTKVEVRSVVGYKVNKGAQHDDLVSLALRFEPTFLPASDQLGIATASAQTVDECALATKVAKRISKRRCVDDILAADNDLRAKMVEETAGLLEAARYDVAAYHEWLKT